MSPELEKAYEEAVRTGTGNGNPFSYGRMNVSFMNKNVHVFDELGRVPYGKYILPPNKGAFRSFLDKMQDKVIDCEDNNEYICYSCGTQHELPATAMKDGAPYCGSCSGKGPTIADALNKKEKDPVDAVNTPTKEASEKEKKKIDSAIAFLQERGYTVKVLIPSYRVAYMDRHGTPQISEDYFKDEEEFMKKNPSAKFLQLLEKLKKEDEEMIL